MQAITTDEMARARRVLMRRDPVLRAIILKYGACGIRTGREADIFCGLVESRPSFESSPTTYPMTHEAQKKAGKIPTQKTKRPS